jgi:hypothetical protein
MPVEVEAVLLLLVVAVELVVVVLEVLVLLMEQQEPQTRAVEAVGLIDQLVELAVPAS